MSNNGNNSTNWVTDEYLSMLRGEVEEENGEITRRFEVLNGLVTYFLNDLNTRLLAIECLENCEWDFECAYDRMNRRMNEMWGNNSMRGGKQSYSGTFTSKQEKTINTLLKVCRPLFVGYIIKIFKRNKFNAQKTKEDVAHVLKRSLKHSSKHSLKRSSRSHALKKRSLSHRHSRATHL